MEVPIAQQREPDNINPPPQGMEQGILAMTQRAFQAVPELIGYPLTRVGAAVRRMVPKVSTDDDTNPASLNPLMWLPDNDADHHPSATYCDTTACQHHNTLSIPACNQDSFWHSHS